MRHMAKRALSLLLALLICFTLFPATALAEEGSIRPAEDGEDGGLPGTPAPAEEDVPGTIVGDGVLDVPSDDPVALPPRPTADEVQSVVASGTCGENLTWTLDDAGMLTISGSGAMTDWNDDSSVSWNSYRENIKDILIGSGVTSIGDWAFYNCCSLPSVIIPEGVIRIGRYAFLYCLNLTNVTFSESVTDIGDYAFADCFSLPCLTIPKHVTSIGDYVFRSCSSLSSVEIPESITSIGCAAFYGCRSLTSVTIPSGVTTIERYTFEKCSSLSTISIPNSVSRIGDMAFSECSSLTDLTIPSRVTSINYGTFYGCSGLTNVVIPVNATSIGASAFNSCSNLRRIIIPASVTSIGEWAFSDCSNLKSILFAGNSLIIDSHVFSEACATAVYPIDNPTWTADKLQNYGGTLTWVGYRDEAKAYTIHFDANGGSDAPEDQIKGHNVDITLTSAVPNRENAVFLGWSTRRGAAQPDYLPGDRFGLNADTTLYAVWKLEAPVLPTEAVLSLGSAKVCAGQEFTVELTMEKNPGLMFLSFILDYDAASFEFLGAEDGLFTGWTVNTEKSTLLWDADGDRAENGVLLRLRFRAKEEAPTGETAIALADIFAANYEEELLGIGSVPGGVTILPHIPGDVIGDGTVDGLDLIRLRKYLAGVPETEIIEANANVNGDDVVDILDLIRLRKYLAQEDVILE